MSVFLPSMRARLIPHAIVILVLWPLVSIGVGGALLVEQSISEGMPLGVLYAGMAAGAIRMLPEFAICGLLLLGLSLVGFSAAAALTRQARRTTLAAEAVVLLLAGAAGVALEFPAVLHHPLFRLLRTVPVWCATGWIFLIAIGIGLIVGRDLAGWWGAARSGVFLVLVSVAMWRVSFLPLWEPLRDAQPNTTVLFGIDSLSHDDDLRPLAAFTRQHHGTWYERAVTPGFLTNTVWASILMHRPVNETGVFFIRQAPDWSKAPFNLVARARRDGFTTVSYFSDQFTTFVGSEAGFDLDRSGPKGWLQVATTCVKDASVFLPLLQPRLPPIPLAGTPANQSGTYAFDVRQEVNAILAPGVVDGKTFVAAHLDSLHQSRYPRYSELTHDERDRVLLAPAGAVHDLSFDWQYPEPEKEPLGVYRWKVRWIQRLIAGEIVRTKFLDPGKNNRLIVFSDHGNRKGLLQTNFGEERFHRVIMATFGVPSRDPAGPISVAGISEWLGFDDPTRAPLEPVMVHVGVTAEEWSALMKSSRIRSNGEYSFDEKML
ncbi:MAG TPA: hypothetical protein VIL97_02530, partial [Thermoanaerobaculia bacterium]